MRPQRKFAARLWWSTTAVGGLVAAFLAGPAVASTDSPPAEVVVVTVNAHQREYDAARMHELTGGIATRTPAAPDVIMVDEIIPSAITSMRDQLNALMGATYAVVGSTNSVKVKMLLNTRTMTLTSTRSWPDVCDPNRVYQVVTAKEVATGGALAVAGVHLAPSFNDGGSDDCKQANAEEVRRQMAESGNTGVVGDFNKRYGADYYECNPEENGAPLPWYSAMTTQSTTDGRSYVDAIRSMHYGRDMASQWSWENTQSETLCTGASGFRRARMDYIFASNQMTTLDAGTDQGWGGPVADGTPGCAPAPQCRYSDHRFLWARLSLGGAVVDATPPAQPAGLTATPGNAKVRLAWTGNAPGDGVSGYNIYAGVGDAPPARVGSTTGVTFTHTGLTNGTAYRYSVTAVDGAGNESVPSTEVVATPDGRIHVGDLDATRTSNKRGWSASVTITLHDAGSAPVGGAKVSYSWTPGTGGTCTTSPSGQCTATSGTLKTTQAQVSLTVSTVTATGYAYDSALNQDPDGDSTGTAITVSRP